MKSAWELAMERTGPVKKLSDEQRDALAELSRKQDARVAELKIMKQPPIDSAKFAGEGPTAALLEDALRSEIRKVEEEIEAEKEKIRNA